MGSNLIKSIIKSFVFITQHKAILLFILLTGAFLRFKGLTVQSLWLDEIITMNLSDPSLSLG